MEWVDVKEKLPDIGETVDISYDGGETCDGIAAYLEKRTCMLAGVGGGNGYFGEGWGTSIEDDCDTGLILDEPTHWRPRL